MAEESEETAQEEPVFYDALFRQKRKHGKYRIIEAPQLEAPVADTHAHLQLLSDPGLALARSAIHGVAFVCTIVDVFEDGATTFERLESWKHEGALGVGRLYARC